MSSLWELTASGTTCHENIFKLLGMSKVTVPSFRGILPSKRAHSLSVATSTLEAMQRGGKKKARGHASLRHDLERFLFCMECIRASAVMVSISLWAESLQGFSNPSGLSASLQTAPF